MMYDNPPYYLSAYGTAVKWGFEGTEEEWLESLTAYGQAVKNGYEGTVQQWLKSLTAYGQAVKAGFEGTLEQWLDSLVGPKGEPFTYEDFTPEQLEGLRGEGFVISGCYEALEQIPDPKVGENYYIGVAAPYDVYTLTINGWANGGNLKGEPGLDGHTPERGVDYWTDKDKDELFAELEERVDKTLGTAARIVHGFYVGTGTAGEANPNTLSFDFEPKMVIIFEDAYLPTTNESWSASHQIFLKGGSRFDASLYYFGAEPSFETLHGTTHYAFVQKTLTWYNTAIPIQRLNESLQLNAEGKTYYYIAIG